MSRDDHGDLTITTTQRVTNFHLPETLIRLGSPVLMPHILGDKLPELPWVVPVAAPVDWK